jgi:hypothetical protein
LPAGAQRNQRASHPRGRLRGRAAAALAALGARVRARHQEIEAHAKDKPPILPVLSMLDRRRTLHRQAREENRQWPAIPMASAVEQCAVRQPAGRRVRPGIAAARGFRQLWLAVERAVTKQKG